MSDGRPPFDPVKASFYLVAAVIGVHAIVVLLGVATCVVYAQEIVRQEFRCDPDSRLSTLLAEALATALAFTGGFLRK